MNGYVLPEAVMNNVKGLQAKGWQNLLWKPYHFLSLVVAFGPWLYYVRRSSAYPEILDYLKAVRKNEAAKLPVGIAGFCWGGQYAAEFCWDQVKTEDGNRLVDCGFMAHPSFLTFPDSIDKIVLPMSVAQSGIDPQVSAEQAKLTESILVAKTAKTKDLGVDHEFIMYQGIHHGFAVRADEGDLKEAEAGKKAQAQAIAWFSRWFDHPPPR